MTVCPKSFYLELGIYPCELLLSGGLFFSGDGEKAVKSERVFSFKTEETSRTCFRGLASPECHTLCWGSETVLLGAPPALVMGCVSPLSDLVQSSTIFTLDLAGIFMPSLAQLLPE